MALSELQKAAYLALCLKPPANTDALFHHPHLDGNENFKVF